MGPLLALAALGLLSGISPTTVVVFIALLATLRGRPNAAAFLLGWTISLVTVFAISYAAGITPSFKSGSGRTGLQIAEVLLGVALVWYGIKRWRRPVTAPAKPASENKLLGRLDKLTPWQATALGIVEQPWTMTAAAAMVVLRHHLKTSEAVAGSVVFLLMSICVVGAMYTYYVLRPSEAKARLDALRQRLVDSGPKALAAVIALVGVALAIDGVISLAQ